jgi:hypothetical protein
MRWKKLTKTDYDQLGEQVINEYEEWEQQQENDYRS